VEIELLGNVRKISTGNKFLLLDQVFALTHFARSTSKTGIGQVKIMKEFV
jgi:hypothetical protein